MRIDQYKVIVEFDVAVLQGSERAERISLELNQLFHEMVKAWVRDKQAIASSTKTTLDEIAQVRSA